MQQPRALPAGDEHVASPSDDQPIVRGVRLEGLVPGHRLNRPCEPFLPQQLIGEALFHLSERPDVDLILTTGGTGLTPRDVTPQATLHAIDYEVPGIGEAMRAASLQVTPAGMLSRAVAGVRKGTLIINLPGNPKAVHENLAAIAAALEHGVDTLRGEVGEHGRPR